MVAGTVLGHEGVGVVEEVGPQVRNLAPGDRVVIPSTLGCGYCSYCRAGYSAQGDNVNPNGRDAGTAFFGGPQSTGPWNGLQAEMARVPFAYFNLVKLPDEVSDDQGCCSRTSTRRGPDRVIDAVGVDAEGPTDQPDIVAENAPERAEGADFKPGNAPMQALEWAVQAVAKAGTIGIVGVYPPSMDRFPIGAAMNKNLTLKMGNCNHRRYIPELVELVRVGAVDPTRLITDLDDLPTAVEAYEAFDRREPGWLKVELLPT